MKQNGLKYHLLLALIVIAQSISAQKVTKVRGEVLDSLTGEPIPFAAVSFKGKNIGTITNYNGSFSLESNFATENLVISSVGYQTNEIKVTLFTNNYGLKIRLEPTHVQLEEVEIVTAKKKKYKNKNNPAVDLIRNVLDHRKENRMRNLDSYSVKKYQKVEMDINNITEKFMNNPIFRNFQEIFNYVDTSTINGKPFLPIYMYETISDVYYRKDPKKNREWILATRTEGFENYIDGQGLSSFIKNIYQEVDIYKSNILFLEKEFTSPISNIAPSVYRYYILDTLMIDDVECFELGFMPRNDASYSFKGKLWIATDSTFAVKQVELGMSNKININWISTFFISQKFIKSDSSGMLLSESNTTIDFDVAISDQGTGIYGKKTDYFTDYVINTNINDTLFKGNEIIVQSPGCLTRDSSYWKTNRLVDLTKSEESISLMSDHIQNLSAFKVFMNVVNLFIGGYYDLGPIELGQLGSLYSFNEIEGLRMGIGFRTTSKLMEKWEIGANLAYGFNDEVWKYGGFLQYNWDSRKKDYLKVQFQRDYYFPGEHIDFVRSDNFFFSFKRGVQDKMVDFTMLDLEFSHEFSNDYRLILTGKTGKESGLGTLDFIIDDASETKKIEQFNTFEIGVKQRFSPNQKFYSGRKIRTVIVTNNPIYEITYNYGRSIDDAFNFDYHRLNLRFFKRSNLGAFGYTDVLLEGEKTFGSGIPFLYLRMHAANQTFTFQEYSANMMNYLEFVSDQYAYLIVTHYFDGLIFNQIPLIKRLKWRSLVSARLLYGDVTDGNNPEVTPGLVQFPTDIDGNSTTFSFDNTPYIEASVGIENIFNLLRIDLVKRFTYLNNPNIPDLKGLKGVGIRFKIRINF